MKFGGPWNLRGLSPQAREAAREAARRSGMSVGEWLNSVIQPSDTEDAATERYRADPEEPDYEPGPSRDLYGDDGPRGIGERARPDRDPYHDRPATRAREQYREAARLAERRETARSAEFRELSRLEQLREAVRLEEEREAARLAERREALRLKEMREAARIEEEREAARLEEVREAARRQAREAIRAEQRREAARLEELREAARLEQEREAARVEELREAARFEQEREAARLEELREAARLDELREAARLDELREAARREAQDAARREGPSGVSRGREEVDDIHARLDGLSQKLERLANAAGAVRPPGARQRVAAGGGTATRLTGAPEPRPRATLDPTEPRDQTIDDAVAEITARQRALDEDQPQFRPAVVPPAAMAENPEPLVAAPPAAPPAASTNYPNLPPVDFSSVDRQLRHITARIEALRPGSDLETTIRAIRSDLTEIGRQVTEALPRRAVESLEIEVKALAQRIDHSRQCGVDSAALAGLERGLAEVREALQGLTTAESLVGIDDAVKALARKVDQIASRDDPAALQQLETAISALRGIVSHVASNDTLTKVAEDVRSLSAKVDALANHTASGHALSALETRIDTLANAVSASSEAGQALPPEIEKVLIAVLDKLETVQPAQTDQASLAQLEKLLSAVLDKLESVQLTQTDFTALANLEDRIAMLVKRFDATNESLGHLEAVERGLADLLVHMEDIRGIVGEAGAKSPDAGVSAIEREVAEIKESERRTQDSLEAVQGTVEYVVDRLATLEGNMHRESIERTIAEHLPLQAPEAEPPRPERLRQPAPIEPPSAMPPIPPAAEPPHRAANVGGGAASPATAAAAAAASARQPIDPNLPPNHPLEPGSTPLRPRSSLSAADRIAASEAVIGGKPPVIPDPGGKPDYIAAARRAAQAAAAGTADRHPGSEGAGGRSVAPTTILQRLRKLIAAGGAVIIVLGGVHVAMRMLAGSGVTPPPAVPTAPVAVPDQSSPPPAALPDVKAGKDSSSAPAPAPVPAPGPLPIPAQSASPETSPKAAPNPQSDAGTAPKPEQHSMLEGGEQNPIAAGPVGLDALSPKGNPQWSMPDITGTVPGAPAKANTGSGPAAAIAAADRLPTAIGGAPLRTAAMAGDPAASYEVATRFAEGRGVPQNNEEAARWFERAAKQGVTPAQFRLGGFYEKGVGVNKDLAAARDLYLAAAQKGNGKAMHNLAVLYAEGINGPADYQNAAAWFRKAAERGLTDSQYNLAVLYARGIGVEQSYAESYKWFVLAANQGDEEAANKRDEMASHLDANALAAAQLAVKNWKPVPQPEDAISVKTPPGGWDAAEKSAQTAKPQPAGKPAATKTE